ncbi:hypothetical protein [Haloarcula rubripromontorii]|uniref:Uncharacterized protein n=1 Tax=Haloarcula rubripromontorii TaxID=1705562 RepID=A0A0M9AKY4_9EURY|nr:hypothetical protein [Haloarcula rubripromontorii]KOX93578.1 hypothetical protein AMS69_06525 [Haloarcula rubripromontorii]NLV05465.1 hypothetical protein [Haloarcula rubripromontorii]
MSKSQSPERVAELREVFVTVTGDESITERQADEQSDRELDPDEEFDPAEVADGLDDAVAGSETDGGSDPAA